MTYKELLEKLNKLSEEQLSQEVRLFMSSTWGDEEEMKLMTEDELEIVNSLDLKVAESKGIYAVGDFRGTTTYLYAEDKFIDMAKEEPNDFPSIEKVGEANTPYFVLEVNAE
ncbi:hypothetical protein [Segatella bryantii]|jgi:hypothetical protein|uniref:hypothetical protein n=1 Tax=Segatella bryantii TaxID=77095 RepID=UPI00088CF427|nr:hypothetical protein [Segatella bryantii]SDM07948.1 hypothetical protein SAMN04487899_11814 [Segatella bryantii]